MIRTYRRLSTGKQSLGLEAQEFACRAFAQEKLAGLPIIDYPEEPKHGDDEIEKRPMLTKLLNDLKRGDVLLVAKCDRLARDQFIQLSIERQVMEKKCQFLSAAGEGTEPGTPKSQLINRTITTLQSKLELIDISERTRSTMQVLKRKGIQVGAIPYGYQRGSEIERVTPGGDKIKNYELIPNPIEQPVIYFVLYLHSKGLSDNAIARKLTECGIHSRKYTPWHNTQVHRMLRQHSNPKV